MKKWNGEPVTDAEYAKLWRAANPEKAKAVHDERTCRKGPQFGGYELPVEKSKELREAFESGSYKRKGM